MKVPKAIFWTAFVLGISSVAPIAAFAEEPMLPPVDQNAFQGEWEGAWSDRSGRLFVALISFRKTGVPTVTISTGTTRPFVAVFNIGEANFLRGNIKIEATGTGVEKQHSLILSGEGWAIADVGVSKLVIEKRSGSGETLVKYDAILYKTPHGFLENAAKVLRLLRSKKM